MKLDYNVSNIYIILFCSAWTYKLFHIALDGNLLIIYNIFTAVIILHVLYSTKIIIYIHTHTLVLVVVVHY